MALSGSALSVNTEGINSTSRLCPHSVSDGSQRHLQQGEILGYKKLHNIKR